MVCRAHFVLHSASEAPVFFFLHFKLFWVQPGSQKWKIILVQKVLLTIESCFLFLPLWKPWHWSCSAGVHTAQVARAEAGGDTMAHKHWDYTHMHAQRHTSMETTLPNTDTVYCYRRLALFSCVHSFAFNADRQDPKHSLRLHLTEVSQLNRTCFFFFFVVFFQSEVCMSVCVWMASKGLFVQCESATDGGGDGSEHIDGQLNDKTCDTMWQFVSETSWDNKCVREELPWFFYLYIYINIEGKKNRLV